MKSKKIKTASSNVAMFPFFECDAGEHAIVKSVISNPVISVNHESRSVGSITEGFKSFGIKLMKAGATDKDCIVSIETGTEIFLYDIFGQDFWDLLKEDQRVVVGLCVLKMIGENLLKVEFPVSEYGDSDAPVKVEEGHS
jgi:hypothetical protein